MEVRVVLAMLLQALRVELAPHARIDRFISITMAPKHGLPMHLHPPDRHFPRTPTTVRGNIRQMVALA
jgi:hypothetical protein